MMSLTPLMISKFQLKALCLLKCLRILWGKRLTLPGISGHPVAWLEVQTAGNQATEDSLGSWEYDAISITCSVLDRFATSFMSWLEASIFMRPRTYIVISVSMKVPVRFASSTGGHRHRFTEKGLAQETSRSRSRGGDDGTPSFSLFQIAAKRTHHGERGPLETPESPHVTDL